jgi:hypothetical protein
MDRTVWAVFDNWDFSRIIEINLSVQSWQVFPPFFASFEKCYESEKKEIFKLLGVWDKKLDSFGGDPLFLDWTRFRPLTLHREEHWSDWLAHLIESSKTGYFFSVLFGLSRPRGILEVRVDRESEMEGYRADLVIIFGNGDHIHIEVKTGDPNLEKTYETARKMKKCYHSGQGSWDDFILLLDSQVGQWLEIKDTDAERFSYRTWGDVSVALRKSLLFSSEPVSWKSWAYAFLGAIEQRLLNHPFIDRNHMEIRNYYYLDSMLTALRRGLIDEK